MSFGRLLSELNTAGVEASEPGTGGDPERYEFHTFGAHFCEMAVHRRTAEPRVRRRVRDLPITMDKLLD